MQDYLEGDPGVGAVAEELSGPGDLVPGSDVGFHGRGFGRLPAAAPPGEKWGSREGTRRLAAEGFGRGRASLLFAPSDEKLRPRPTGV